MQPTRPRMAEILQPGKHGRAELVHFEVSQRDSDLTRLREAIGHRGEYVPAGKYVRLMAGSTLWMSDTPFEWDTCREFVWQARGDVLIAGLGLGMVLLAVQARERVTSITVLEKDPDVMALVAPQLPLNSKVRIVQADVFKWQRSRGQKFDTLWFDIWADICGDNARDFPRLRALYKTARRTGAWTGMWSEDLIR